MAKKNSKKKSKRRILILGFLSVFIIIATTFTIGKYWVEIFEKYQEKKDLEKELTALKEKEEELTVDANKLQNPDYIARYAREKYLYSKDGEYILQIPEE
jgi:cell division protein DivIC